MGFKRLPGISLSEKQQGLVRFICLNEATRPKGEREKIQRLCDEVGGAYSAALKEVMCSQRSISEIAMRHYVSESTLYRLRREFYESWYKKHT